MTSWDDIRKDYIQQNGQVKLKDFAKAHNVKYSTLRSRKNRENWEKDIVATEDATQQTKPKSVATKKHNQITKKPETVAKAVEGIEEAELTEKQRLFCLYYVKSFNATQSAVKAGYSKGTAHVIGHENLRKPKIAAEIRRLKGSMTEDIFVSATDVLRKYIEIAFADITDYLSFGREEVFVGLDDCGDPITKELNVVKLRDSSNVDGSMISEVSQGKDGIKLKMLDKMKALEKLELYFDLFPDKWKRKIEEEKLKLSARKAGEEDEGDGADDGFIEALKGEVSEAWSDEET